MQSCCMCTGWSPQVNYSCCCRPWRINIQISAYNPAEESVQRMAHSPLSLEPRESATALERGASEAIARVWRKLLGKEGNLIHYIETCNSLTLMYIRLTWMVTGRQEESRLLDIGKTGVKLTVIPHQPWVKYSSKSLPDVPPDVHVKSLNTVWFDKLWQCYYAVLRTEMNQVNSRASLAGGIDQSHCTFCKKEVRGRRKIDSAWAK